MEDRREFADFDDAIHTCKGKYFPKDPAVANIQNDELALLKRQLLDAQKMSALGELVSTTTHEFNNVLMTVINYAKMGLRNKDEASRDKAFQRILDAGERAAEVTQTILATARNRSDGYEPTDIHRLVKDVLVLLDREMARYQVHVDLQAEETPNALANGNQIQQVVLNLLINARQAMPQGGEISIKIFQEPNDNFVSLRIRDNGCGIPQDKLPRIFEPYFSTKSGPDASGKGGTGLGLSSCHQIIEAHQGRLRVQSTVGKGTAFTIKLPVAPSSANMPTPAATNPGATNPGATTPSAMPIPSPGQPLAT